MKKIIILSATMLLFAGSASAEGELTIRQREAGSVTVLDLKGKITESGGTAALHKSIRGLLEEGKTGIVLNLEGVSKVDDGGFAEMIASYTACEAAQGALKLLNVPDHFNDLLSITKFLTVFQTFDNEDDAVASFN
jgi:anti-sigma B factor antagonist